MLIDGKAIIITGKFIKIARIEDEVDKHIGDPEPFIEKIKADKVKADIFTFWQGIPYTETRYKYYMEFDNMAVLHVKDFKHWWEKQIDTKNRTVIRKAEKAGVVVKLDDYTDEFVKGIVSIYNESPMRQGKPFWHYGKDFDTVKRANERQIERSDFIGAYFNDELIGFIKLVYGDGARVVRTDQIISKIAYRDKKPTNALVAKAVEICASKNVPYFLYAYWPKGSLADFKRHMGFQEMRIPRYYVPLTIKGKIALRYKLHHGIKDRLPEKIALRLMDSRKKWYERKLSNAGKSKSQEVSGTSQ